MNRERILLSEEKFNIELYHDEALTNLERAKAIYLLHPFSSQREFQEMVTNSSTVVKNKLLEIKEIKQLDAIQDIMKMESLKWPANILNLKSNLEYARQKRIDFTYLVFENDEWKFDSLKFDSYCDRSQRKFAETPEELKRYHAAKALADYLNDELKPGEIARNRINDWFMLERRNGSRDFFPSVNFIKNMTFTY